MLVALFPTFFLVTVIHAQLCQPDGKNALKVRLSLKTALGDKAYTWNENEEYLFKAMVAFSIRTFSNRETIEISNVQLCNVTKRVSFWFVVTDPSKTQTLPAGEVQAAIRMNRNRINNAFFLNDQTLEFLEIPATLGPPPEPSLPVWIIIFGIVFFLVIAGILLLIVSGIRQRTGKSKASTETGDVEEKHETMMTVENGIPCDTLDSKEGRLNRAFAIDDEKLTPL